jgi:hypothetical protein
MPHEPPIKRENVTMDGEGHAAKVFGWTDDEDEGAAAPAFDPATVLRAIEAEDDEDPETSEAETAREDTADLGAALRAALAYEAEADPEEDEPEAWMSEQDDEDGEPAADDEDDDAHTAEADWEPADGDENVEAPLDAAAVEDGFAEDVSEDDNDEMDEGWSTPEPVADDEDEQPAAPAALRRYPTMDDLDAPGRKPRIALMGEFSAGKSTLSNLLIGAAPLPMKVTATQLPPVWISWGDDTPYREDIHGETHPVDIARLSEIDPAETRMIRIFEKSEVLEACDILDMPGISDPNMGSEVWERVIGRADGVIWCTHATQAWRQTEASVWESLDPGLFDRSLLLITRFDKLLNETDRARVLRRVERETEGLFSARLPISLTRALAAGDDPELQERSGAAAFRKHFLDILDRLGQEIGTLSRTDRTRETLVRDGLVKPLADAAAAQGRVLPRRVRPLSQVAPARD